MSHKRDVEFIVDCAAREVAIGISTLYGCDYVSTKKLAHDKIMEVVSAASKSGWVASGSPWLRTAQPPEAMDVRALEAAFSKWWDGMDDAGKLSVIMGPAGHHKSEYVNNLAQKYKDKPEAELSKDLPDVYKMYRAELGAAPAPEQQATSESKARPYKGQNPRVEDEADEYSTWHDLSDPGLSGKDKDSGANEINEQMEQLSSKKQPNE